MVENQKCRDVTWKMWKVLNTIPFETQRKYNKNISRMLFVLKLISIDKFSFHRTDWFDDTTWIVKLF